ncbi:hypothetical protein AX17_006886 [Amanita inopinata Kibby_2008]|nr:hypothetical protein AX17_006886 [Amanita inopinata Kibby_2008]
MFSKLAVFATIAFAAFAAATPIPGGGDMTNSCNTGPVQCCNSMHESNSAEATNLLALVGASVQGVTGSVGAQCSPLTVIGVSGGSNCNSQPVCCKNNNFNGLVAIGCSPINLNL